MRKGRTSADGLALLAAGGAFALHARQGVQVAGLVSAALLTGATAGGHGAEAANIDQVALTDGGLCTQGTKFVLFVLFNPIC